MRGGIGGDVAINPRPFNTRGNPNHWLQWWLHWVAMFALVGVVAMGYHGRNSCNGGCNGGCNGLQW